MRQTPPNTAGNNQNEAETNNAHINKGLVISEVLPHCLVGRLIFFIKT